uniref:Gonadoliberin n=1 Tax=Panthera leo TaxID=9689 RepID=A0A8C8WIJ3_PANLE
MAGCRLGLLLLLLLTAHPGCSKAQHWSRGWYPRGKRASSSAQHPQYVPRLPGRVLGTAASRPDKAAHNLPNDARTTGLWSLHRKQRLVQTLQGASARRPRPAPRGQVGRRGGGQGRSWAARASAKMPASSPRRPNLERRALQPSNNDVNSLKLLPRDLSVVPSLAHPR